MEHIWSPWRYQYIAGPAQPNACVFCSIAASTADADNFVLFRAEYNYAVLNRYPYTSGHLMIVPYRHGGELHDLPPEAATEMMCMTQQAERCLRAVYRPDGVNLGMNLGKSAGAGVAGHLHMHALPRWEGDANFMTTIAETRILPEALATSYERLGNAWPRS